MIRIKEDIFQYYIYFILERMSIFWKKYTAEKLLTDDPVFKEYKFTNVYRATDRVSQYLIRNVIYRNLNDFEEEDILFRIIFFKIFNKIETWDYIEKKLGPVCIKSFNPGKISDLLSKRRESSTIFNNAYMMTGTHSRYNYLSFKHEKWLAMLQREMIESSLLGKIMRARSLEELYKLLRNCSLIGDFLAYQYAIDLNYSPLINFSEDSFVKAGIGAVRGIKKCFHGLGAYSFEDAIRFTQDNLEKYLLRFPGHRFENLFGREPTLIDLQNCFCETDKYLRAKMPNLKIGNVRIKQKYKSSDKTIAFYFPPKWGLMNKNPVLPEGRG